MPNSIRLSGFMLSSLQRSELYSGLFIVLVMLMKELAEFPNSL